jgi:hypothetical protein
MVLARVANFFTNGDQPHTLDARRDAAGAVDDMASSAVDTVKHAVEADIDDDEAARPPYIHVRTSARNSSDRR